MTHTDISMQYRSGKNAGILAATDRSPHRRHTTERSARVLARTGREHRERAFWLGYLRGFRTAKSVLAAPGPDPDTARRFFAAPDVLPLIPAAASLSTFVVAFSLRARPWHRDVTHKEEL